MAFQREWDPKQWQGYTLKLVQLRHGAHNVQTVPDKVHGDAGIEFFTMNGCLYQSYAPEEVFDVKKAASAMKAKGSRDLKKLEKNKKTISEILQGITVRRWILLCPFLDNKEVVAALRKAGKSLKGSGLDFLAHDFEALVQSQEDFAKEIEILRMQSQGAPIKMETPSQESVEGAAGGDLGDRLREKLDRAFPNESAEQRRKRAASFVRSLLTRDNTLETLLIEHPVLWEKSRQCLDAEEQRLSAIGTSESHPSEQLAESMERIEKSLRQDLQGNFPTGTITQFSTGTVADWLVRCPLDFPPKEEA